MAELAVLVRLSGDFGAVLGSERAWRGGERTDDAGRSCANTITVVGEYQNPPVYGGTYGFEDATSSFKHTTRYEC